MGDLQQSAGQRDQPSSDQRDRHCISCEIVPTVFAANDDADLGEQQLPVEAALRSASVDIRDLHEDDSYQELDRWFQQQNVGFYATPSEVNLVDLLAKDEYIAAGAAPLQVLLPSNHYSWAPGEHEERLDKQVEDAIVGQLPGKGTESQKRVIIVDTPVDYRIPDEDSLVTGDRELVKWGRASHGTFVTSLIRRIGAAVDVKAPSTVKPDTVHLRCETNQPDVLTHVKRPSELDVAVAIYRAYKEHVRNGGVLNISLGAYPCGDDAISGARFKTLKAAIDLWLEKASEPLFAAAGNARTDVPFYPAAFQGVRAVAATDTQLDQAGEVLAWHERPRPIRRAVDRLPWMVHTAPGLDLIAEGAHEQYYLWSGSSFASAVMAGTYAVHGQGVQPDYSTEGLIFARQYDGRLYSTP